MNDTPTPIATSVATPEKPGARRGGGLLVIGIFVALALYVLSIGPAVYLVEHDYVSEEHARLFYAPLIWLCRTEFGDKYIAPYIDWYARLWY